MTEPATTLTCANHPGTETMLRCNNCEKPICARCAILTPTGYRCKECVRGQQKKFDTAKWYDYPLIFIIVGLLSFFGSWLVTWIGFFTIFLAPFMGLVISEIARFAIQRRRAKRLFQVAAIAAAVGALPFVLMAIIGLLIPGYFFYQALDLLWLAIYLITVPATVYTRLHGINIR